MDQRGWIVVFGKPPVAGAAKTRLAAAVGSDAAARVARALLLDTWAMVARVPGVRVALSTPAPERPHGEGIAPRWDQGGGSLGERIERTVRRGLADAPWVLCLGADAPHVPPGHLTRAVQALEAHDAVIGPAEDGGYWCLGLRTCPDGLLDGIPWSTATTCEATWQRLGAQGLSRARVDRWWDIDEPADLRRLLREGGPARTLDEARRCWP